MSKNQKEWVKALLGKTIRILKFSVYGKTYALVTIHFYFTTVMGFSSPHLTEGRFHWNPLMLTHHSLWVFDNANLAYLIMKFHY